MIVPPFRVNKKALNHFASSINNNEINIYANADADADAFANLPYPENLLQ